MKLRSESDDMVLGMSLAALGLGLVSAALFVPAELLGPGPFGVALLLLVGLMVVLLGAGYLNSDRLQRAFGQLYMPDWVKRMSLRDRLASSHAFAMAGTRGGPWPERRAHAMDRRLALERRVTALPFEGPDRRSGLDRRLPWDRREGRRA